MLINMVTQQKETRLAPKCCASIPKELLFLHIWLLKTWSLKKKKLPWFWGTKKSWNARRPWIKFSKHSKCADMGTSTSQDVHWPAVISAFSENREVAPGSQRGLFTSCPVATGFPTVQAIHFGCFPTRRKETWKLYLNINVKVATLGRVAVLILHLWAVYISDVCIFLICDFRSQELKRNKSRVIWLVSGRQSIWLACPDIEPVL